MCSFALFTQKRCIVNIIYSILLLAHIVASVKEQLTARWLGRLCNTHRRVIPDERMLLPPTDSLNSNSGISTRHTSEVGALPDLPLDIYNPHIRDTACGKSKSMILKVQSMRDEKGSSGVRYIKVSVSRITQTKPLRSCIMTEPY